MWNYLPKIGKTIRIPPSMMMSSWMGSDLTNDDLVKETTWEEDYHVDLVEDPPPGQVGLVYVPKEGAAVTWSKVIAFLDAGTKLPTTQEYYDEKGRKVRLMEFKEVRDLGGRTIPARMVITPLSEDKQGRQTELIYRELTFDQPLPESLFSLSTLRRGR
jgi:outer membrane lipoprotein-sorting protein